MRPQRVVLPLALLSAAFLLGCQEQASEPVGLDGVGIMLNRAGPHPHGGGGGGDGETFKVTVETVGGSVWTAGAQTVQSAEKQNWLHVFDSGGNGTKGRPNYDNAAFDTKIFLQPASDVGCVSDPSPLPAGLRAELFDKLNQGTSIFRVFDFQVNFDIADNPEGFSIFLFRWKDGDRIFSASTGFGLDGSDPAPSIDFLGADADITDPTITRVFRISGAKVIARELRKNKVIATLACPNEHSIDVTVAPN